MTSRGMPFDQVGYWSEVKLDIIKEYAAAYSKILSAQKKPALEHIYIDAFAGAGVHVSRTSGEFVAGSPMNALLVKPPFRQYHFIDLDEKKVVALENLAKERSDVQIYHGDCNRVLLDKVLPQAKWEDYRRALCILDPYGLHLDWRVIAEAGRMRSVDIFLNFPIADMNRNVLWRDRQGVAPEQIQRMNAYWGDESWKKVAYAPSAQGELFGPPAEEKASNEAIAEAFRKRLNEVAGFKYVPHPIAMRNSQNAVVYYLYFASQKPVAEGIVRDILNKYRDKGAA
ncbi:MAG: three-Cys-motif partner protein TcmP [Chloroflexi bacterium]|nr:three-Cys-motif partner protein TcmP [Chloroflexota bacterium]